MKFEEVLPALRNGKKIRIKGWFEDEYIYQEGEELFDEAGFSCSPDLAYALYDDWEIVDEPKWTDEKIVEWHKKTFPDCTYDQQVCKLFDEMEEYYSEYDYDKALMELADVYIVALTTRERFGSLAADNLLTNMYENNGNYSKKQISFAVSRKMDINVKRKWKRLENGTYQHEEK